jgi:transposase
LERDGKMGVHLDGSRGVGVSRLEVIEGPSGRRRRTKAERARIAAESMMPGVTVADVARRHGTTRWQIYDWRKQVRSGNLVLPEGVAALPIFAELVVDDSAVHRTSTLRCGFELDLAVQESMKQGLSACGKLDFCESSVVARHYAYGY